MKVIKKINNNVAICVDNAGNELIAIGKGIGFPPTPYELENLDIITRTFYGVNPRIFDLIGQIDENIVNVSSQVIEYASTLNLIFDENVVFTLADHIQFAIERMHKGMAMKFSLYYELEYRNSEELKIGRYAYDLIKKKLKVVLPSEEVYGFALHLLNAQSIEIQSDPNTSNQSKIEAITEIIESHFGLSIPRQGFNYSRFISHMEYLFERMTDGITISSVNLRVFDTLKLEYPRAYQCTLKINEYFKQTSDISLSDEELLYLLLHINRLCSREDCYR